VARATIVGPSQRTVETLHVFDEQRAAYSTNERFISCSHRFKE
jgi:hypothetical protein